jgi:hypothetical protein
MMRYQSLARGRISRLQIFPNFFLGEAWDIKALLAKKFGIAFFADRLLEFWSALAPAAHVMAGLPPAIHAATQHFLSESRIDPAAWMPATSAGMTGAGELGFKHTGHSGF